MTGLSQDPHGIVIGFALASLGFGLFRPGFTAGASLAVPRRDQGSLAGMTASINGSAYIVSPAVCVLLYNWHAMVAYGLLAGFCAWLVLWGWVVPKAEAEAGGCYLAAASRPYAAAPPPCLVPPTPLC